VRIASGRCPMWVGAHKTKIVTKIVKPLTFLLSTQWGRSHGEIASAMPLKTSRETLPRRRDLMLQPGHRRSTTYWSARTNTLLRPSIWPTGPFSRPPKRILNITAWRDSERRGSMAQTQHRSRRCSRAYLLRSGSLLQLTGSFSRGRQVRRGILTAAEPKKATCKAFCCARLAHKRQSK